MPIACAVIPDAPKPGLLAMEHFPDSLAKSTSAIVWIDTTLLAAETINHQIPYDHDKERFDRRGSRPVELLHKS